MARKLLLRAKGGSCSWSAKPPPAWTNTNRVNKANQFTPRPVQLNNIRPKLSTASKTIKIGRVNVNTGHGNVSSGGVHVNSGTQIKSAASRFNTGKQHINSSSVHINTARVNRPVSNNTSPKPSQVNLKSPKKCFSKQRTPVNRPFSRNTAHKSNKYAGKGKMDTDVKTSAGCVWRKIIPLSNTNYGPTPDTNVNDHPLKHMEHRGIFDSGCSGHMTGNRAHLEDYQELSKVGSVTFGGSKGSISGKGTIRLGYKRGTIDKTLFIRRNKEDIMLVQVYVDDIIFGSTNKSWCDEFEVLMQSRFQMSSMGELTFFLGLQVKQNKGGIFISQDKYVAEILKKFDLVHVTH
ncbi:putative ribonuclease H-like domain-containing protein [Tanacetum coccineum]